MESGGVYVVIQSPQRVEDGAVLVPQVGHLFAPKETHRLDRLERSLLSYIGSYGHKHNFICFAFSKQTVAR